MTDTEYETLKNLLKTNVMVVTFKKVNGDIRIMNCTLKEEHLPEYDSDSTRKKSENVLSVWETEQQDWRSFRYDSVISYHIKNDDT